MSGSHTLKDLARMLKMSPSTVSKALNDYPSISEMTRKRVKELAKRVNFTPNQTAISFKSRRSFSIGVIIPDLLDHFYTIAVSGIEAYAMSNGYKAIVCQHYEDKDREREICEMLSRHRVDGLIVSITKRTTDIAHFKRLEEEGIPVVYFVRRPEGSNIFTVTSDVYKGTMDAVQFLVGQGHRRIAHILGPSGLLATKDRHAGYLEGLRLHNLPFDKSLVMSTDLSTESTEKAMDRLLNLKDVPTAVIVFKDHVALDAMYHLKQLPRKSKREIAFIGFGNLPLLKFLDNPPLATLEEQCSHIGNRAAELLMKRIRSGDRSLPPESITFDCTLKRLK